MECYRAKRIIDLMCVVAGLIVLSPLMLAIALAVKRDDGGPVFFRQERVGRHRRPFAILKFRTMRAGTVTRVGRWLRSTGLDELAQFLNVLSGDMSLVGPRPLTAADLERLGWSRSSHDDRFELWPGVSGLAQIYGEGTALHSRRLERLYVVRSSPILDLGIIAVSFAMNLCGKRRVRGWLRGLRAALPLRWPRPAL